MSRSSSPISPAEHFARAMDGDDDPMAAWIRAGLEKSLAHDLPLTLALGLPTTPRGLRLMMRDWHIKHAGTLVAGSTTWNRACALADAVHRYHSHKAAAWHLKPPPEHATDLERAIHAAARYAPLPTTRQAFQTVLESR